MFLLGENYLQPREFVVSIGRKLVVGMDSLELSSHTMVPSLPVPWSLTFAKT